MDTGSKISTNDLAVYFTLNQLFYKRNISKFNLKKIVWLKAVPLRWKPPQKLQKK